jgi:hypothetical protein
LRKTEPESPSGPGTIYAGLEYKTSNTRVGIIRLGIPEIWVGLARPPF